MHKYQNAQEAISTERKAAAPYRLPQPLFSKANVADGEIIGSPSRPVIFCGHSATAQGYTVKSTPESWRDNVARLVAGNPSMVTAIAAAFAAPMLALT
ncbi:hypothetical protein GTPT_0601 [Tatumella ptyseos ATCC 33301]|uniref:DUF927 domain-containing protein n=2 Tax=Tatumella ptyseos TaxID=82987 RepID=A0A085JN43_9GAMM|nr:hypothetical protein GTPT_0601 [Tatumella ptyseos ATCC 33301]SQK77395.1 Superfamily II helicase and inactivated derivatives [Tatumella ptyseos]